MITAEQIRGGRALLRWSARQLADVSGVSWATVQRMEAADGVPPGRSTNLEQIQRTLERAGVIFIDAEEGLGGPGVRLKEDT
jgi:predicted transcriptional regulator